MQPSRRTPSTASPVAGLLLMLAVLTVVAACGAVGAAVPSPSAPDGPVPSAPASPAPSDDPLAQPSADPSGAPTAGDAIDLDTADDHDVSVVIEDQGGLLAGSASGRAGDGMSVRWGDVDVVNVDEDTLRVTWVGLPVDTAIRLVVAGDDDGVSLAFTQPAPPANSDAIGFDRVLVLDFAASVRAADVEATFVTAG